MSISSVSFSLIHLQFSSVMSEPLDPTDCSTLGFTVLTISRSSLKLRSIESVMPSSHLVLYRPLLLLPSIFSSVRVFSNESGLCIRWPKYWNFSLPSAFPVNIQDRFPLGWTGWISQESSPTPQFKNINSLVLSSSPTLVGNT